MKQIMKKISALLFALVSCFVLSGCVEFYPYSEYDPSNLRVHFIDVGQADCNLIQLPGGKSMLIDAGNNDDGPDVVRYIMSQGIHKLDIVVGTHPHEDHIGGLDDVIKAFDVGDVYMPKVQHNTKTFRNVLSAVKEKDLKVQTAKAGVELLKESGLEAVVLAPVKEKYEDLNNYSAIIRMVYGNTSFLFTGDAEKESEEEISGNVQADVLKTGHHGSSTSTTKEFLQRVNPKYALISCGTDNSYGHPHKETPQKLEDAGVIVFRTDMDGTVIFESNGKTVRKVNEGK